MLSPQTTQNSGQLVRVQNTDRRQPAANELDSVFESALSEFEQLERNSNRPEAPSQAAPIRPTAPENSSQSTSRQTRQNSTSRTTQPTQTSSQPTQTSRSASTPVPDLNAMVTAAHLQALNTHSQLIQRHSDGGRADPAENQRLHSQTMAAHADLMAAHRQFMTHFCAQSRPEPRTSQPVETSRPATLQDTMERNLRQYFGGQKKRKNTTRNEPQSKARNTQLGGSTQTSEC